MTGPAILIISIIIVLVVGFVLTFMYVNSQTNIIVKANQHLMESQMELMEQNKRQEVTIDRQSEQIEIQHERLEEQRSMMDSQKEQTSQLLQDLSELKQQLRAKDVVAQLCAQAEDRQIDMEQLQSMSDEVLLAWFSGAPAGCKVASPAESAVSGDVQRRLRSR